MHSSIVSEIAGQIGTVHEVDLGIDGSCMGKFVRARVTISLAKPLQRCVNTSLEKGDKPILILLIYERLSDFCYGCGKIGHVLRDCEKELVNKSELEYGPWLHVGKFEMVRSRAPNKSMTGGNRVFQIRGIPSGETSSITTNSQRTAGLILEQDNLMEGSIKSSQIKSVAERELEEGPNLSIVAVDSVGFPVGDNNVGSKVLVDEGVDVVMDSLGTTDMTKPSKEGAGSSTSFLIKELINGGTQDMNIPGKKVWWRKKARMHKGTMGSVGGGLGEQKIANVVVGDKRRVSEEKVEEPDGVAGTATKRSKEGHDFSSINLATTAVAVQQPRRAQ